MAQIEDQKVNLHVNISPDDLDNIVKIQNLFELANRTATKLRKQLEQINALEKEMEGRKWTIS